MRLSPRRGSTSLVPAKLSSSQRLLPLERAVSTPSFLGPLRSVGVQARVGILPLPRPPPSSSSVPRSPPGQTESRGAHPPRVVPVPMSLAVPFPRLRPPRGRLTSWRLMRARYHGQPDADVQDGTPSCRHADAVADGSRRGNRIACGMRVRRLEAAGAAVVSPRPPRCLNRRGPWEGSASNFDKIFLYSWCACCYFSGRAVVEIVSPRARLCL